MGVRQFSKPTGFPVPLIMRGMGAEPRLVSTGYGPRLVEVLQRVFKAGKTRAKEIGQWVETYAISAALMSVNGRELETAEQKRVTGDIDHSREYRIKIKNITLESVKRPLERIIISAVRVVKGGK